MVHVGYFYSVKVRNILAKNLRNYRLKSNLTQEELAWKSKLTPDFIGRVERAERTISLDNLEKIAKALGVDLHLLLIPESYKTE
jgi:transcriptional regulator with XRE-family HTH domain